MEFDGLAFIVALLSFLASFFGLPVNVASLFGLPVS